MCAGEVAFCLGPLHGASPHEVCMGKSMVAQSLERHLATITLCRANLQDQPLNTVPQKLVALLLRYPRHHGRTVACFARLMSASLSTYCALAAAALTKKGSESSLGSLGLVLEARDFGWPWPMRIAGMRKFCKYWRTTRPPCLC